MIAGKRDNTMRKEWEKPGERIQCATFQVGGIQFGIDVQHVQEVLQAQDTTRVPKAPAVIRGLINLRGQIVTAIDMRKRLGLPGNPETGPAMNVVIRTTDGPLSLLVDDIGEVIELYPEQYEEAPANLDPRQSDALQGVYKLDAELLLLLDPEHLAELPLSRDGMAGDAAGQPGGNRRREG